MTERTGASQRNELARTVGTVHAAYWIVTGIWPIVSIGTFQLITGRKRDLWLVKTVGALLAVIGVVLGLAAREGRADTETTALAVGSACTLGIVDVVYYRAGILRWVYLVDAVTGAFLSLGWLAAWRKQRSR